MKLLPDQLMDDVEFVVFINGHGKHGDAVYYIFEHRFRELEDGSCIQGYGGETLDMRLGDNPDWDDEYMVGDFADFWFKDRGVKWQACEKPSVAKNIGSDGWVKIDG